MRPVEQLQRHLIALGYDPGKPDDDFGPKTATAYVAALRAGPLHTSDAVVVAARAAVRARTPHERDLITRVGTLIEDDPKRPGYGRWRTPAARANGTRDLRVYDVPLLGRLVLSRHAAGPIIAAWGEVEVETTYRPGRACSMCYRRMDRDPSRPWSVHCTGHAGDGDLDRDGKWERVEAPMQERVLVLLEGWGLELGVRWRGRSRDDMHFQWARVA